MSITPSSVRALLVASLLLVAEAAGAQTIGTFRWQQQPYCNVLTLTVVQSGASYLLDGSDDQCNAGRRASAAGVAFANPDGTIGIGLTLVTNNGATVGGSPLHIDATLSLATVSGTWRDSSGATGAWTFVPSGSTAGNPRPLPAAAGVGTVARGLIGMALVNSTGAITRRTAGTDFTVTRVGVGTYQLRVAGVTPGCPAGFPALVTVVTPFAQNVVSGATYQAQCPSGDVTATIYTTFNGGPADAPFNVMVARAE